MSENETFDKLMDNIGVAPIKNKERQTKPCPAKSAPVEFQMDSEYVIQTSTVSLQSKFSGVNKKSKKNKRPRKNKINRNFQPDAKIDLHGNTREEAINRVEQFLHRAIQQEYNSILIITGKGTNLDNQTGVLQKTIWNWLENRKREEKIRFKWAPAFLGGKGAILVFL